jgi:hypothetical protein
MCPSRNLTKISELHFFCNDLTFAKFGDTIPRRVAPPFCPLLLLLPCVVAD